MEEKRKNGCEKERVSERERKEVAEGMKRRLGLRTFERDEEEE